MLFLKQSTAATVLIGPVLDSTGGLVTSGLVIGDLRIAKNGTIATMSGNTLTHSHAGHWTIALGTGDTDTTGRLTISVGNTSYAMAFRDYTVLLPGSFGWLIENAPNTTGGLATATGTISAFAGAISTFAGGAVSSVTGNVGGNVLGNVQGSVASVTNRVTANTDQLAGQTVTAAAGVTFPASVASPTNITSASGVVLASTTHTGAVIPTVSTVTNGVTVSDKTGFKLASDGLVSVTSWTVAITGNITGNLSGSVGSVTGAVGSVTGAVGSVTGNVGGNVVGSVGSVTGSVGSVASPVTAGTVNDKTGFSLTPTTGLGNQTANITGSLSGSVGSVTGSVGSVTGAVGSVTGNVGGNVIGSVGSISGVTFPSNFASLGINASGHVSRVTLVDTTTTNTDMRGTDGAALATNWTATRASYLDSIQSRASQTSVDALPTATSNAAAVWNALVASYTVSGSFGAKLIRSVNTNNEVQLTGGPNPHIAASVHAVENAAITSAGFAASWFTAAGLASDAVLEIADGVWDEPTSGHTTAGTTGKALIDAGSAGNPWSTDISTGYTGTQAGNILNQVKANSDLIDDIGINVYPVSASTPERVNGTTLTFYRDESRSVSVVTDFTLTSLTLRFVIEDNDGADLLVVPNGSISRSGQTFTVGVTTAVTATVGNYRWSMRDITSGDSVIAFGVLTVQEAASNG